MKRSTNLLAKLSLIGLIAYAVIPMTAQAAVGQLTARSATLNKAAGGSTNVTSTFAFTPSTTNTGTVVKAIKFQMCDSPVEAVACTAPDGTATMAAAAAGAQSGTDMVNTYGAPTYTGATTVVFTNATGNAFNQADGSESFAVGNITIPLASNKEFYFRVTTYSDTGATVEVDYGGIAVDTSQSITVSGTMPESLVFCVGTSGTTCAAGGGQISGNAVDLGTFSPTSSNKGTSVMAASTNAGSGYAITINGTTLTSGANTITAMGTQSANSAACAPSCTSATGASQFGTNVRANNVASAGGAFGADVTPTGAGFNGAGFNGYNTANSFRFFTGDTVASSSNVSDEQLFTNSYIVNVPGSQAAGLYSATLTYICTATF